MKFSLLKNEKGVALISVYVASMFIIGVSVAAFGKAFYEMKQVDREVARIRSFAAAEAGLQSALAQIGSNAYTGFINTNTISNASFQSTAGASIGSYSVTMTYPNQADWVIVSATGTVDGDTKTVEGRVFLDSNLSKYLVYADTSTFSSGDGAQYGEPDTTGSPAYPELVSSVAEDRAALYFTGDWSITGAAELYGDANAEGGISGVSGAEVHGDVYTGDFTQSGSGAVTNDGVSGSVTIGDGFSDDTDRDNSGSVTSADSPDYHDLNSTGGGDSHKTETLTAISSTFYAANNNTSQYVGASAQNRYLKFVSSADGTYTQIYEYSSTTFTTQTATYTLPASAIVYVKGDIYIKGEIGGRVSVVSSDDIFLEGNMTYSSGQITADSTHSAAFMAKDKIFFRANTLTASGILYGENSSGDSTVFDATYNTSGASDSGSKSSLHLSGNRIMNGSTNLSYYDDRVYGYDKNLKYFRPPGIPVVPSLRVVREA